MNKNKRIPELNRILNHSNFCTKITIYMSKKSAGTYYDGYEQNYTYTHLNPITIKGYVSEELLGHDLELHTAFFKRV